MIKRAEIRKDYIQEKYVIIAPKRNDRPHLKPALDDCPLIRPEDSPFSPNHINREKAMAIVGAKKKWQMYVVRNKFPAVSLDNPKAYGVQEIIVETPNPNIHLEELSLSHIAKLLKLYADRAKAIAKLPGLRYILIFKNKGGSSGASLCHAHSQIFATKFIPPQIQDKAERCRAYTVKTGRCVYCDTIAKERNSSRLVWEDKNVIAFTPYASMHDYEIWILPKQHRHDITKLTPAERKSWAKILQRILFTITHHLYLPYNYYFHQLLNDKNQHLYMKIVPRDVVWGGVEVGSGLIINAVPPEAAAKLYREAL